MTAAALPVEPLFTPDPASVACSQLTLFVRWCEEEASRRFPDCTAFDRFLVEGPQFWSLFLTADARLFPVRPREKLTSKYTCLRSPLFGAEEMDELYSELVLLPI